MAYNYNDIPTNGNALFTPTWNDNASVRLLYEANIMTGAVKKLH
jgi:hypothetical protein